MSNVILTHRCNKGCSYCFAAQTRDLTLASKENIDMTLDEFKRIVDQHAACNQRQVKLLGGEPTQHPQFADMLQYCFDQRMEVTLISNFLFKKEVRDVILRYLNAMPMHFLVNSTELDKHDRMATFKENYNTIYQFLYQKNIEQNLSCGITIDQSLDPNYYVSYLQFLQDNLTAIERMRLSIAFPGSSNQKGDFYFINNKKLGDLMIAIVKTLNTMNIPPSQDCILFPCMFEGKEEMKYMSKFFLGFGRHRCGYEGGPTDYMPDGSAFFCYPNNKIAVNTKLFKTATAVQDALKMKYMITKSTIEAPETCVKCGFFQSGQCDGPCLGFFDYEEV